MNPNTTREVVIWERSAVRHTRDGEPVAAALAQHLAHRAQAERDEFDDVRQLAQALHRLARQE